MAERILSNLKNSTLKLKTQAEDIKYLLKSQRFSNGHL